MSKNSTAVAAMQAVRSPADKISADGRGDHRAEPLLNLVAEDGPVMESAAAVSMQRVITAVLDRVASQGAARGLKVLAHSFQDNVLQEDDGSIRLSNGAWPPMPAPRACIPRLHQQLARVVHAWSRGLGGTGADLGSFGRACFDTAYGDALALRGARDRRASAA